MKYFIIAIIVCASFFGCSVQNNSSYEYEPFIEMRRSPGRGINPEYVVMIFPDGVVEYNGIRNVKTFGDQKKLLPAKELRAIQKAFKKSNFFSFEDIYSSKITDLQTTIIKYKSKNDSKKIRDYHNAPTELKRLEEMVEQTVLEWIE